MKNEIKKPKKQKVNETLRKATRVTGTVLIDATATYKRVKGLRGTVNMNTANEEILLQYIEENKEGKL